MKIISQKIANWGNRLWQSNSGNWHWLKDKPVPVAGLNRSLWRGAVPSGNFYILLFLSGLISTLGLVQNSTATIIGAMIIAPLMGPIIAIAYAMVAGNRRLFKRATLTLFSGIALTIITAIFFSLLIGLTSLGSEIMGRARPNLIDLGVALAAGAAGAFAKSRKSIADTLPGVAIAVALVPPLSVVGIGIAHNSYSVSMGAALLFLTNLIGIIFSGAIVFLGQQYGSLYKAGKGIAMSVFMLILLGLPLGFSFENLLVKEQIRRGVALLIEHKTITFSSTDIRTVEIRTQGNLLLVDLEVVAPLNSVSANQVKLVRAFLERELKRPIALKVKVIPINTLEGN